MADTSSEHMTARPGVECKQLDLYLSSNYETGPRKMNETKL